MNHVPIVIEQSFQTSVHSVWEAITDAEQMRQWFFPQIERFVPEVGFETQFNVNAEGRDFLHVWKVTEVVPQRRLVYQWRYDGYPGDSMVVWDLSSIDRQALLKFTHEGHETIGGDPMFTRENCEAGWNFLIKQSLVDFLSKN